MNGTQSTPSAPGALGHQELGAGLADSFRKGQSLIESAQTRPPAMGLPTQRFVSAGQENNGRVSHKDMYYKEGETKADSITATAGNSVDDRASRRARDQFGKPRMTPAQELGTLEQYAVRLKVDLQTREAADPEINGPEAPESMRFATVKQANAVNLSHGGEHRPNDRQMLRRDGEGNPPQGFTVDLAQRSDTVQITKTRTDAQGKAIPLHERGGGVQEEVVERKPANQAARTPKTLYHVDQLKIDTRPARMYCDVNHDAQGQQLLKERNGKMVPDNKSGATIRDEKGAVRRTNHDENRKPIDDKIGALHRDEKGEFVMTPVVNTRDSQAYGHEQAHSRLETGVTKLNAQLDTLDQDPIKVVESDKASKAEFSVDKKGVATLTVPTKVKDKDRDQHLTDVSRAVAHAEQWGNPENPNHENARKAQAMKPADRAKSAEYAACELSAQSAAMAAVTRAGGTYKPQDKASNDKLREHWAKQVETPEGLQKFGKATDMARRVCDGKAATRSLEQERRNERAQDRAAAAITHAQEQQQEQARDTRGTMENLLRGGPKPVVRGADRPTGGGAPPTAAAPAPAQSKTDGGPAGGQGGADR